MNVFTQQNRPLAGLEHGKNGILPFFGHFLPFGGIFPTPTRPAVLPIPWVSLPPYQWITRERFWPLERKIFIFFMIFGAWSPPAPSGQMSPPREAPLRPPPCHITFFTSIQCLRIGLHHLVHSQIYFTAQCHPTFSRGHNSGFQPFWAIFANFAEFLYWFGSSHKLSEAGSHLTPPHTITKLLPSKIGRHGGNLEHLNEVLKDAQ